MEHLSSQLDMLSLGHVSPSIITPTNLKKLLLEMQSKLPYHLTLPEDPMENLWKYYQSLTCTTVLDEDKVLVIVSVPLLDRDTTFEIYRFSILHYHIITNQFQLSYNQILLHNTD